MKYVYHKEYLRLVELTRRIKAEIATAKRKLKTAKSKTQDFILRQKLDSLKKQHAHTVSKIERAKKVRSLCRKYSANDIDDMFKLKRQLWNNILHQKTTHPQYGQWVTDYKSLTKTIESDEFQKHIISGSL